MASFLDSAEQRTTLQPHSEISRVQSVAVLRFCVAQTEALSVSIRAGRIRISASGGVRGGVHLGSLLVY